MTPSLPPLSFAQEQLWFIDEFHHGLPAHNVPGLVWLEGELDVVALGQALGALISRHETLRTRLVPTADGHPGQLIDPAGPDPVLELTSHDGAPPHEAERRLRELADEEALRPFHLADEHPLRARLIRLAAGSHALVLVVHQTAIDQLSLLTLIADLAALYQGFTTGQPAELAPLPTRFAGLAARERERLRGWALDELSGYWRTTLAGFETSRFPADRPRPVLADHDGAIQQVLAEAGLTDRLREVSREAGTTLAVTLLAAQFALLHRYTGQEDLILGLARDARSGPEAAGIVAFLEDVVPVRVNTSGDPGFRDLLDRVRTAVSEAAAHDLPFARIVDALAIERDPGRFPVFQTAFRFTEPVRPAPGGAVTFRYERVPLRASRYDLGLTAEPGPDGLRLEASYPPSLYDPATARRLLVHYEVLLAGVAADPSARLSQLPLLTEAELRAELADWNDTDTDLPVECVHEGIERQVAAAPGAVAVELEAERVSYQELNRQANQIARLLRSHGVGPEILVGVAMTTSPRRLAALLATWKAGG
ncbi:MAG TPA: condensation domain-containing protein, partial [Trebonia sp.]|nr:condensation domain-containing protein [Trebonia sp.]